MLKATQRHLYRDRRRLATATLLLLAVGALSNQTLPPLVDGVRSELLVMLALLAAIPAITVYLPKQRHWIEIVLAGTVLHLGLGHLFPGSLYDPRGAWGNSPLAGLAYAVTVLSTGIVLYGRWSDRFAPLLSPIRSRARLRSRLGLRALWYGLVPTPGQIDRNPDAEVVSIDYADAERRTIRLVTWLPPRPAGETLLHIDEMRAFRYVRLRMQVIAGLRDREAEGTTEFSFEDRGNVRVIHVAHTAPALPPRRLLRGWLDDTLGRVMDARLNAVERHVQRRLGRMQSRAKPVFEAWYIAPAEVAAAHADRHRGYRTAYGRRASNRERAALDDIRAA